LDENLKDQFLIDAIARWYSGKVIPVQALRLHTVVKDDVIPQLLLTALRPTFVTINVNDFWRKVQPHPRYSIVGFRISQDEVDGLPTLLRRLLTMSEFRTKTLRMGKIILVQESHLKYYARDGNIHTMTW